MLADAVLHSTLPDGRGPARKGRDPARDRDDPGRSGTTGSGRRCSRRRSASTRTASRSSATGTSLRRPTGTRCCPTTASATCRTTWSSSSRATSGRRRRGPRSSAISAGRRGPGSPRSSCRPKPLQLGPRQRPPLREGGGDARGARVADPRPDRPGRAGARPPGPGARGRGQLGPLAGDQGEEEACPHDRRLELEPGLERALLHRVHVRRGKARGGRGGDHARPDGPVRATGASRGRQVRKAYRQSVVGEINTCKTMSGQAVAGSAWPRSSSATSSSAAPISSGSGRVGPADLGRELRAHLVPEPAGLGVASSPRLRPRRARGGGAPASVGGRPDFEEIRLPNGARIVFQPDRRLPNLHLRLLTHGGPVQRGARRRGSSALLATLLTKDTRRRSAAEVARQDRGGGRARSARTPATTRSGWRRRCCRPTPTARLELIADGAPGPGLHGRDPRDRARRPARRAARGERRRGVLREAAAAQEVLRDAPFRAQRAGRRAGRLRRPSRGDLSALWKRLLVGPGAVLSVAGDFDPGPARPQA